MIALLLVSELYLDPEQCNNVGPGCFTCPAYDACDHHYDESNLDD